MIDIENLDSAWKGHRQFAYWLVEQINPKVTVDLGVDYGYSLFCLAEPAIGTVYGIDSFEGDEHAGHHPDAYEVVKNVMKENQYNNIELIKGMFDDVAKDWFTPIDILHIDGLHTYDAVKNDYETWSKFLSGPNAVIIMHDVALFPGTKQVFDEIPMHKAFFHHSAGLGVLSQNQNFINLVKKTFSIN